MWRKLVSFYSYPEVVVGAALTELSKAFDFIPQDLLIAKQSQTVRLCKQNVQSVQHYNFWCPIGIHLGSILYSLSIMTFFFSWLYHLFIILQMIIPCLLPSMKPPLRGEGAYLRGFKQVHEQEKLVGAMLLRSIRINGSSLC